MESKQMPALFIGHGSPMNAIEDNAFSQTWESIGKSIPRPDAILCVSAHWETHEPQVTAMEKPRTIHDFGGFPRALYEMRYPAPGSPELARRIIETVHSAQVLSDTRWGLDHGTWSVLCRMFPEADIPVVQLSLDRSQEPPFHYALGQELRALRKEKVLVLGSGNVVHNLYMARWEAQPYDWAVAFDAQVKQCILENDHQPLIQYEKQGQTAAAASLAINSAEHYLPLLYILGAKEEEEPVQFFAEEIVAGSLSMRCVQVG